MKRRELLKTALGGAFAPAVGASAQQPRPRRPGEARRPGGGEMPNVLWICTDQQRFDTIQELNNAYVRTPNLQRLMAQSTTFTHAFVQAPVCTPSRASFLTGRYPRTTGACHNGQRINENERLVPRILADYGYECGLSGKLHLSPVAGGRPENRIDDGYSQFWWSHDIADIWPGQNMWHEHLRAEGVEWPQPPPRTPAWGVPIDPKHMQTAWCCDKAIQFMRQQSNFGPWLMSVNIYQPHHPFWPAEEYYRRYDPGELPAPSYVEGELDDKPGYQKRAHTGSWRGHQISGAGDENHHKIKAAYYAMVEQCDHDIGRMLDALDETGQAENTVVIFMSDHGEMLGDHGIYLKGPFFYDCGVRVPLMIRWPERYQAGRKVDALVELADIAPTILEAAGIPPEPGMQGRSLTALLEGRTSSHRDSVYIESYNSGTRRQGAAYATAIRTGTHKLAVYHTLNDGELYDLTEDPGEHKNLWRDPNSRDVREELLVKLTHRMAETVDPLPPKNAPW